MEALDDGADIDCNGCSPIFFAIENGCREVLVALVERGADVAMFELDGAEDVVGQLLKIAPQAGSADDQPAPEGMVDLDAKMIRAFDRMLRSKGVAEPIKKGRWAEYRAFCDGLRSLAAEECHVVVSEFLERFEGEGEEELKELLAAEESAGRITGLNERYATATAEELPGELLKEYLKERKKLN